MSLKTFKLYSYNWNHSNLCFLIFIINYQRNAIRSIICECETEKLWLCDNWQLLLTIIKTDR